MLLINKGYHQQTKINKYLYLFLLSLLLININSVNCDENVFAQEFTDKFFLVKAQQGWQIFNNQWNNFLSYTSQSICDSMSILGGYSNLGGGSILQKVYTQLPPHYELKIQFNMYFIDNQNIPYDNVQVTLDNQDGGSFSLNNIAISRQICGLQSIDRIWNYSKTISHTNPSLTLKLQDNFDETPNQISWGIRDVYIIITGSCYKTCASCNGPNTNQCLTCVNGSNPTNGICPDGSTNTGGDNNTSNPGNTDNSGSNVLTACDIAISDYAQYLMYSKTSEIIKNTTTFEQQVIISVKINFDNTNIPLECRSEMINKIFYKNTNTELQLFPSENITLDLSTYTLKFQFDLADTSKYAQLISTQGTNQVYSIYIIILTGNSKQLLRDHKFELYIQIQGEQTFNYLMDVNVQETNQDICCLVIVDPPIKGEVCQDEQCNTIYKATQSVVKEIGDDFIVRLSFTDKTYKQKLNLNQILFKGDQLVLELTGYSTILLNDGQGTIIVKTQLFETSKNAVFQYNLKIGDDNRILTIDNNNNNYNNISELQSAQTKTKVVNEQQSYQFNLVINQNSQENSKVVPTSSFRLSMLFSTTIAIILLPIF